MIFLSKFLSCCGCSWPQEVDPEPMGMRQVGHQRHHITYDNNNKNNNNNNIGMSRMKKRGRAIGSRVEEWKPTLASICENNVMVVVEEWVVEKKSSDGRNSSSDINSLAAIYEESRRDHYVRAMPAFSATPFFI